MPITTQGHRKNRLKVGDKIRLKFSQVKEHRQNLIDWYTIPISKELKDRVLNEVHFWITHYLDKTVPQGKVIGYGSDEGTDDRRKDTKFYIAVQFTYRKKKIWFYTRERDVVKL